MSQGSAAATAESLPRQTASTLAPHPILRQALSPSHPSGLGHSEGPLQAQPHRQAPLRLAGPWPSASPQHGPRCESPVLQDVYLPPEKWACFEWAPESPQRRCSGVTPEPGLRPWALAFGPGTSQLPANWDLNPSRQTLAHSRAVTGLLCWVLFQEACLRQNVEMTAKPGHLCGPPWSASSEMPGLVPDRAL